MRKHVVAGLRWAIRLAGRELPLLLALLVAAGGVWAFLGVAEEVLEGDTRAMDTAVLLALRNPLDHGDPLGPGWLEEIGRDATAAGGVGVLTFVSIAVVIFLVLQGRTRTALFVALAIAGGMAASFALKLGFDRPRPDLVPHGSIVYTASFPSGHSMMSAVVYLTLGALLARVQPLLSLKIYIVALAVVVTLLVGVSRVYLGVHWPTDVLAGWSAGASWAVLCWTVVLWLQRRRQVEPTGQALDAPDDADQGKPPLPEPR